MKTISIPTHNRPEFLHRVLESIRACKEHPEWSLVFSCEPDMKIQHLIAGINWAKTFVSRNLANAGINVNTLLAANLAYSLGSEFNLYLEEDTMISSDALTLANEFRKSGMPGVLCLRRWHKSQTGNVSEVKPDNHGLLGNGFAWPRALWERTIRPWWLWDEKSCPAFGWDWSVSFGLDKLGIPQWRPMVNRSQNIGVRGTNTFGGRDLNHFGECHKGPATQNFNFIK